MTGQLDIFGEPGISPSDMPEQEWHLARRTRPLRADVAYNDCEEYIVRASGIDARENYLYDYREEGGGYGMRPWPTFGPLVRLRWVRAGWRCTFDLTQPTLDAEYRRTKRATKKQAQAA